jgi:5'-nucleotidase (lipoprotein e(P4) family)
MNEHPMTKNVIAAVGLVALLVAGSGCQSTRTPAQTPKPTTAATGSPGLLQDSLRWVRDSAEYRAAALQAYRAAATSVTAAAQGRRAGSWAVVLDADETVISNLQYQIERGQAGLPYSADSWRAWVARRAAVPIPGAARFLAHVRDLGGRIAIVTNRLQSECLDTEALFNTHGLAYDAMLCRPDTAPSDKNPRFDAVAAGKTTIGGPLDIVAFVGDNILDFPKLDQASAKKSESALDAFGASFFMLPNPMYGSWQ